jgi:gliding motility-associated-like protein
MKKLLVCIVSILLVYHVAAQTCNTVALPDSLQACAGSAYTLSPIISGTDSVLGISWTPATGLSGTTILDPVITPTASGYYRVSVISLETDNLVTNGDFSAGNTGFSSSYTYRTVCCTFPGYYEVATDPHTYYSGWPTTGDHTSGSGNMLMVDGSETSGATFWCETIAVTPGTNYVFSFWTLLLASPLPSNDLVINGTVFATFTTAATSGSWTRHSYVWNSGTSTSAAICMKDTNLEEGGNDFAIDDVSMYAQCVATDSIYVNVTPPDTTYIHTDTSVCITTSSITLTAPAGYTTHAWTDGSAGTTDIVGVPGTYRVYETATCKAQTDTFHVTAIPLTATNIHTDTVVCSTTSSITLTAPGGYLTHTWNDGTTGATDVAAVPGTYRVYETSGVCTSLTDTFHISTIPPATTFIHTDTVVCANLSAITLTAPAGYTSYTWNDGTVAATHTVAVPGSYWVHETGSCATQTDTFHITTKPIPIVNLGDDTSFCSGNTVTLRSLDGPYSSPSYLWSTGSTSPTISVSASGNYSLLVTVSGCSASDTVNVNVIPTPPLPTLGSNSPVCSGNTLLLTAALPASYTSAATYSWSGPLGFTSALQNPSIAAAPTSASGIYYVIASFEGCSSPRASEVIVVDSTPARINVVTPLAVCQYDTLFLSASTATPGVSYSWTGPLSFTSALQDPVIYNTDTTQTGTYVVTATLGICSVTANVAVTINPVPVLISDSSNSPVCEGNTLLLYSAFTYQNSETFSWRGPAGFTSAAQNPVIAPVPLTATGVYSVSETRYGCTSPIYTIPVIVNISPGVPDVTANTPVCIGDTLFLLSTDTTAGITYSWTGPNGFLSTLQDPALPDVIAADGGTYSLTVTLGACSADSFVAVNTSYFKPSSNSPVCTGDTLFLYANGAPGATYVWTGPYAYYAYDSTSATVRAIPNVTTENAGIYTVTAATLGCLTAETDNVIINTTPPPPFVSWLTYCQYYPAPPLMANDTGLTWYPSDTMSDLGSTVAPVPSTATAGSGFYYVAQTVNGCSSAIDSIQVTVHPKPAVTLNVTDTGVCPHSTIWVTATDTDAIARYQWSPDIYLDNTTTASVTINPETSQAYTVVAGNQFGCTDTAGINVMVYPAAVISLGPGQTIYPQQAYTLSPETNCTSFSWFPPAGLSNSYIPDPAAMPSVTTKYILSGTTENGCTTSDSITLFVSDYSVLAVPNAFTPGNGPDNMFLIIKQGAATLNYFRIYNRWGQQVFETTNINEGWNGTFNGTPQPFGVYVYDIEAVTSDGHTFKQQGNVTLLR